MAWIRIDDHFDEHPKFARAGPLGIALWLAGLAYCNRNLTDGFIPWSIARSLTAWSYLDPNGSGKIWSIGVTCGSFGDDVTCERVIWLLLEAGLWEERVGGYYVHDYPDYQPCKEDVLKERVAKRNQRVAAGIARASTAIRENGRFAPQQLNTSVPATSPAERQRDNQRNTSPVPVPKEINTKEGPAAPADYNTQGIGKELTSGLLRASVRSRTKHPMREPSTG